MTDTDPEPDCEPENACVGCGKCAESRCPACNIPICPGCVVSDNGECLFCWNGDPV